MHLPAGLLPGHRERQLRGYAVAAGGVDDHPSDVGAAGVRCTSRVRAGAPVLLVVLGSRLPMGAVRGATSVPRAAARTAGISIR